MQSRLMRAVWKWAFGTWLIATFCEPYGSPRLAIACCPKSPTIGRIKNILSIQNDSIFY